MDHSTARNTVASYILEPGTILICHDNCTPDDACSTTVEQSGDNDCCAASIMEEYIGGRDTPRDIPKMDIDAALASRSTIRRTQTVGSSSRPLRLHPDCASLTRVVCIFATTDIAFIHTLLDPSGHAAVAAMSTATETERQTFVDDLLALCKLEIWHVVAALWGKRYHVDLDFCVGGEAFSMQQFSENLGDLVMSVVDSGQLEMFDFWTLPIGRLCQQALAERDQSFAAPPGINTGFQLNSRRSMRPRSYVSPASPGTSHRISRSDTTDCKGGLAAAPRIMPTETPQGTDEFSGDLSAQ